METDIYAIYRSGLTRAQTVVVSIVTDLQYGIVPPVDRSIQCLTLLVG